MNGKNFIIASLLLSVVGIIFSIFDLFQNGFGGDGMYLLVPFVYIFGYDLDRYIERFHKENNKFFTVFLPLFMIVLLLVFSYYFYFENYDEEAFKSIILDILYFLFLIGAIVRFAQIFKKYNATSN